MMCTLFCINTAKTKPMFRSPDVRAEFFDLITRILLKDILAIFMFINCQDYILRISIDLIKENGFTH